MWWRFGGPDTARASWAEVGSGSTTRARFFSRLRKRGRDAREGRRHQAVEFVRRHASCYSTFLAESAQKRVVVAIDGPSGAGKSTIAKRLAERLGFTYIDTGAMYRAVALWGLRQNVDMTDMHRMEQLALAAEIELAPGRIQLNGEDVTEAIRVAEVSSGASRIATMPGVRRALVAKQRSIGERSSVVMEGRDIGTVVFPQAQVKIFLDARPDERVRRRLQEVRAKGEAISEPELAAQLEERDRRDSTRAEAPLAQAPDAVYLDSTSAGHRGRGGGHSEGRAGAADQRKGTQLKDLLVMKFGGTSVGSAGRIRVAADLIAAERRKRPVAMVVSAMSKITDLLLDAMRHAEAGGRAGVEANLAVLRALAMRRRAANCCRSGGRRRCRPRWTS